MIGKKFGAPVSKFLFANSRRSSPVHQIGSIVWPHKEGIGPIGGFLAGSGYIICCRFPDGSPPTQKVARKRDPPAGNSTGRDALPRVRGGKLAAQWSCQAEKSCSRSCKGPGGESPRRTRGIARFSPGTDEGGPHTAERRPRFALPPKKGLRTVCVRV